MIIKGLALVGAMVFTLVAIVVFAYPRSRVKAVLVALPFATASGALIKFLLH